MMRAGLWLGAVVISGGLLGCFDDFPQWPDAAPAEDGRPETDDGRPAVDDASDRGAADDGAATGDAALDVQPLPAEACNGRDDDLDGATDEGFPLAMPCTEGQGACAVDGRTTCRSDGMGVRCDATPGRPVAELCNGIDDDCSGVVDEGFESVGEACDAGLGACLVEGRLRCADDGAGVACDVQPNPANQALERCNGLDDDCDGSVDEGLVRSCTIESVGACVPGRQTCTDGDWSSCVGDFEPSDGMPDLCDGLDNDCDAVTDEDVLVDDGEPCGEVCDQAAEGCEASTPCVEQCDPASPLAVICGRAPEADCDGRDDDCDGVIDDDAVCGGPMVDACFFGFGWSVDEIARPAAEWGGCDVSSGGFDDTYSCNRTQPGEFATVDLPRGVDLDAADDKLGVTFRCSPGDVGDYIVAHCRIVLGVATAEAGIADGAVVWGPCPAARVGGGPQHACTSNTGAGEFLPMPLPFDLAADSLMGVAFICEDPVDPARAAALQASLAVSLGWADSAAPGEIDWAAACAPLGDGEPLTRCATTRGDGRFRVLRLTADVDGGDRFGISLGPL